LERELLDPPELGVELNRFEGDRAAKPVPRDLIPCRLEPIGVEPIGVL
jgi:hypothetical protein